MRAYELMVIIDGDLDEAAVQASTGRVKEALTSRGFAIAKTDPWGKRRFAYEIDHKTEGTYVVFEATAPPGVDLVGLERTLRLADDIVRHKVIRLPDREAARRGLLGGEPAAAAAE